ncbi:DUF6578 domain-containing protein [Nonomuraea longicatena]
MRLNIWVDGWQMDCCGEPFQVGSHVTLKLRRAETESPQVR